MRTDRELVNALIQAADIVGRQSGEHISSRSPQAQRHRDWLAEATVERLIKRDEQIEALQDKVADLRHELNGYR